MEDIDLFTGTRELKRFSLSLDEGKATLACIVTLRWHELLVRTLKCGAKYTRKLTSKLGIEKTQREDLEAVVKGSLGFPGVGKFESAIQAKAGFEARLEYASELEETFEFDSPKCGIRTIMLYQLQWLYQLTFKGRRFFKDEEWERNFVCWSDRIHDGGRSIEFDSECGCEPPSPRPEPDGSFYINLGRISLLSPFNEKEGYIYIPGVKARLTRDISRTSVSTVNLQRRMIPKHLLFLAREDADAFQARFVPYDVREQEKVVTEAADAVEAAGAEAGSY